MTRFLDEPNNLIFSKDQIAYSVMLTTTAEAYCTIEVFWKKDSVTDVLIASTEKGLPDEVSQELAFSINSTIDAFLEQVVEAAFSSSSSMLKNWTTELPVRAVDGLKFATNSGKGIFFEEFKIVLRSYQTGGTIVDTQEKELQVFLGSSGNQASSFFSAPLTLLSNQPQSKQITPAQNELLYMHCAIDAVLELDINVSLSDGSTVSYQFFGVNTYGPNKVVALGVGYADLVRMTGKKSADALAKIDAPDKVLSYSVQWKMGSLKARKQEYMLLPATRHERQFLFWESGGSWATFSATGQLKTKLKTSQETGTRYEFLGGRGHSKTLTWNKAVAKLEYKLQTGFFSREMRQWLQAFAESHSRYEVAEGSLGGLYPIVLTSKSYNLHPDEFKPKSVEFSYRRGTSEPLWSRKFDFVATATESSIKLSGFAQNTGKVDLSWVAVDFTNATVNFEIWRGADPANLQKVAEGVGLSAYADSTTSPETTYYYQIRATENAAEVISNFAVLTTPAVSLTFDNIIITESDFVWVDGTNVPGSVKLDSVKWLQNIVGVDSKAWDEVYIMLDRNIFEGQRSDEQISLVYFVNGPFGQQSYWANGEPGDQITLSWYTQDFSGANLSATQSITVTIPTL